MPDALGSYDGRSIVRSKIKITKAGDGLSQALAIDPQMLHWGDKVYVVLECDTGPVTHKPIKDSDNDCEIVFSLVAGTGTIVAPDLVKKAVEAQTAKIIAEQERVKGLMHMDSDTLLSTSHANGQHDDLKVPLCPDCYPPGEPKPKRGAKAGNVTPIGEAKSAATKPKKSAAKKPAAKKAPAKKS